MGVMAFDTLKFSKRLTAAGMDPAQAEVLTDSYGEMLNEQIATKEDISRLETVMDAMEQRLESKILRLMAGGVGVLAAYITLVAWLMSG